MITARPKNKLPIPCIYVRKHGPDERSSPPKVDVKSSLA